MEIELEVTYLAKYLPENLEEYEYIEITDYYISPQLRIRQQDNTYDLIKKTQIENDPSQHAENTIQLSQEEFQELSQVNAKKITKKRYFYPYEGATTEIDIFTNELSGLVLVEYEFPTLDDLKRSLMPEFCLCDVTRENFISGKNLAGKTYEEIEHYLHWFDYKKIENRIKSR